MPRAKAVASSTPAPKKSRSSAPAVAPAVTAVVERKRTPIRRKAVTTAAMAIPQFDVTAYHDEIAEAAYLNWLQRAGGAGSPEEDWIQAENTVRIKHTASLT